MRVSTNIHSLTAQRYLKSHTDNLSRDKMKLSNGERIISSADDPAGLAISEKMRARVKSNYQAERNANDAISFLQVAEGSLSTMNEVGHRLRELAVQAANDTLTDQDRVVIDLEFQSMKSEIKRLTKAISFNGNNIINESGSVYELQIGVNAAKNTDRIEYDMSKFLDASNNFGIEAINLKTKESSQQSLEKIDMMEGKISKSRAMLGSLNNRMNTVVNSLLIDRENTSAAKSKIKDADYALETAKHLKDDIGQQATLGMLKIANDSPSHILKLIS